MESPLRPSGPDIERWLAEDGFGQSFSYWQGLPNIPVDAWLNIKSSMVLAGLPWFVEVFQRLQPGAGDFLRPMLEWEGRPCSGGEKIPLPAGLRWGFALSGERLALNLLQRASAVASATRRLVELAQPHGVQVLDTRKTSPGLRELEKYAVAVGGGHNHRFTQVDTWMVKDNHKALWGLRGAVEHFRALGQPYKNIIVEIHAPPEIDEARALGVRHFLLDNFTPEQLRAACAGKRPGEFFEVSGGINEATIARVLMPGIDAVSSGAITQFPVGVDISFKFKAVGA